MCLPKASERPYFSHIPLFFFCCFFASCFMWFPFLSFICHCNFSSFKIQTVKKATGWKIWTDLRDIVLWSAVTLLTYLLLTLPSCCRPDCVAVWTDCFCRWANDTPILIKNTFCPSVCPPVSLNISPKCELYFRRDSVSLSCVYGGWTVDGWAVRRLTGEQHFAWTDGSSCIVSQLHPSDSGVYWCETSAGQWSDPVNISVSGTEITCPILSGVCPLVCILLMD